MGKASQTKTALPVKDSSHALNSRNAACEIAGGSLAQCLQETGENLCAGGQHHRPRNHAKRRNTDFRHSVRCVEHSQKLAGKQQKHQHTKQRDHQIDPQTDPQSIHNAALFSCAVIVGDDRYARVAHTAGGHDHKTLEANENHIDRDKGAVPSKGPQAKGRCHKKT